LRAAKVDANQSDVVHALLKAGCKVTLLHRVGAGCPDLLVCSPEKEFLLMEIKDGAKSPSRRTLTPEQELWHKAHEGAPVYVISSVEEAIEVLALL
jgi:hypothetical protein